VGETRDTLESEFGVRSVGTAVVDEREIPVVFATSEADIVAALVLASSRNWRVLPIGSGTKLEHGPPREKPKFAISLRGFSGVTSYERGDGTITARAGSTMAALSEIARSGGNHLTPDVSMAKHATLGGTIASGLSGLDRLRYGPVRNHVLGVRVALGDGTVVKSGGRLVKNVTGFDVHRLVTGSRGSLCVVLEASLRLFPLPVHEIVLETAYFGRDSALSAARAIIASALRPVCVAVSGSNGTRWSLVVGLAGRRDVLAVEVEHALRLVGDATRFDGLESRVRIDALRVLEGESTLSATFVSSVLPSVLATIDSLAPLARIVIHPGVTAVHVAIDAAVIVDVACSILAAGASVEIANVPVATRSAFDPLEHVPATARDLMRRLKFALDPAQRFVTARPPEVVRRG